MGKAVCEKLDALAAKLGVSRSEACWIDFGNSVLSPDQLLFFDLS